MCEPDAEDLLKWYDKHARNLPWRVPPADSKAGLRADPYRVWLSEIMLQQTTVAAVAGYYERFLNRWPDVAALAAAKDGDVMAEWAGLGYYARARNLLKCARMVQSDHGGHFPQTRALLQTLPGIGPYTSAAIAAIAFDKPETVVDGNVERVMARLHDLRVPLPQAKPELTDLAAKYTPHKRPGDYAQAVMDLGATVCMPRNPACKVCPWIAGCRAYVSGDPKSLPLRSPRKAKPVRYGFVYVSRRNDGAWLLENRPETGLLGGMLGFLGTDWAETPPEGDPPFPANWHRIKGEIRHTFTHFHLRLMVCVAAADSHTAPTRGYFLPEAEFSPQSLPTLMRKAFNHSESWFADDIAGN